MMKYTYLTLTMLVMMSCNPIGDTEQFFSCQLEMVKDVKQHAVRVKRISQAPSSTYLQYVYKDYSIAYEMQGEFFITVNDLSSGDVVSSIMRKGRGPGESVSIHPQFTLVNGELGLYDYSKNQLFTLDIEDCLNSGKDVITGTYPIVPPKDDAFQPLSIFKVDDVTGVVHNSSMEADSERLASEPYFASFNLSDGSIRQRFSFFKNYTPADLSENMVPKVLLNSFDCVNPKEGKLFFAMTFMPVYGILNINTGDVMCFDIRKLKQFMPGNVSNSFLSVDSDGEKVYALYSGASGQEMMTAGTVLYVFDWDGNIVEKMALDAPFRCARVSDGEVYLMDYDGYVYTVE